jgi:2-polyprenyl-6-methoxyphenol hydroxylase-like FAD-dependent oxidoreductase
MDQRRFKLRLRVSPRWYMPTSIHHTNMLLLSGDACHPMLPYLAQGANSAVEDGAVLGLLLGHIKSKDQLPKALSMYEALRKSRGEAIVRETFKQVWVHYSKQWVFATDLSFFCSENLFICQMDQLKKPAMRLSCLSWALRN